MGVSIVEIDGKIELDLTNDSVTPETLAKGATAHDKSGEQIVGTMESGGQNLNDVLTEQEASIEELKETLRNKASVGELNLGTCTVIINVPSKTNYYICKETVSDGAIAYNITKSYTDAPITTTSRCDSVMYIVAGTIKGAEVTDGEVLRVVSGQGLTYKTPNLNNSIAQVTLKG